MTGPVFSGKPAQAARREAENGERFRAEPSHEGPQGAPRRRTATILLVDDESSIRSATRRMLRKGSFDFKEASDGNEGLGLYQKGGIDLVITDLRMPGMGGLELLQRIMAADPNAKVLVSSGNFRTGERDAALCHGAYATLDKPYDIDTLNTLIEAAMASQPQPPAMAEASRQGRVLIVDDDPDGRDALAMVLGIEGHSVKTAENGLDGLAAYFAGGVDLVISDLHMPRMDGHEMLREILKGNPKARVIMLSAEASEEERRSLAADGAFAVMRKPVDVSELLSVMGQALGE